MIKYVKQSLGIVIVILTIVSFVMFLVMKTFFFSGNIQTSNAATNVIRVDTFEVLPLRGEVLFKNNCNSCHSIHDIVVGPALYDIRSRQSNEQIIKWIKNPQELIFAEKDGYAVALFKKYDHILMPSFPDLTNNDIDDLISYIENCPVSKPLPAMPEVISCP